MAQEEEAVPTAQPAEAYIRGDMIPQTPEAPGKRHKSSATHPIHEKKKSDNDLNGVKLTNTLLKTKRKMCHRLLRFETNILWFCCSNRIFFILCDS